MNLSNRVLSRRIVGAGASICGCLLLANCMSSNYTGRKVDPKYGVTASPRVVDLGQPVPKGGGVYHIGKPYVVAGKTYYPEEDRNYTATGIASWYGADFHGRRTANGEIFDMESITAAHPTMPIPSYARVTNLATNKSLIVRVNDRGPYHGNRVMDLSVRSAKLLGFHGNGLAKVKVEYVGRAPIEGSDNRMLVATLSEGRPAPAPSRVMLASAKPFIPEDRPSHFARRCPGARQPSLYAWPRQRRRCFRTRFRTGWRRRGGRSAQRSNIECAGVQLRRPGFRPSQSVVSPDGAIPGPPGFGLFKHAERWIGRGAVRSRPVLKPARLPAIYPSRVVRRGSAKSRLHK